MRILLALCVVMYPLMVPAAPDAELLETGNAHFRAGRLEQAEAAYRTLVQSGVTDPAVHFNLGQLYRGQRRTGRARTEYLKALQLRPEHAPSRAALEELGFPVPAVPRGSVVWLSFLAFNAIAAVAVVRRRRVLGAVCLGAMLITGAMLLPRPPQAVVLSLDTTLQAAPDPAAAAAATAESASLWTVTGSEGGWVRLEADGRTGWVRREQVEVI